MSLMSYDENDDYPFRCPLTSEMFGSDRVLLQVRDRRLARGHIDAVLIPIGVGDY